MKRIYMNEFHKNRVEDLMNQFFDYEKKFKESVGNGDNFIDCHEWQIHAANIVHDLEEEGLLNTAKEMYSWEKETINDYLLVYEEIQSGVRI